ncbi:MAG: dephospho-CoA kinase [Epsilonproteobacteria bacterium]|nr:dephospho-CoA kinase [Campylobacterota bacterium]
MNFRYAVALTGGIATGKSSVSEIFRESGFDIIDADMIVHSILDRESRAISDIFGEEYILDSGEVNRRELGRLIFSNSGAKRRLESLIHPLVYRDILDKSIELDGIGRRYIVDIPLFFETGRYKIDEVIVVYTPKDIQLERLMRRDGISRDEALLKIESQIDIEEKRRLGRYIIDNSGDFENLRVESLRVVDTLNGSL